MVIPATPNSFIAQTGNGQVYLSWNLSAGATSYHVQRSTDGVTYSIIASPAVNTYQDTTVTPGTQYYYQVASVSSGGTSPYTTPQTVVPTLAGQMTLGQIRLAAQQRADRVNSNFVTPSEWNMYINQSYFELYDLLTTLYEDYYVAPAAGIITTGSSNLYALPDGVQSFLTPGTNVPFVAPPFYKLMGVDCGLDNAGNAWVTLKKFNFISRNKYVYPNISSTFLGVFNLQYRLLGNNIELIPTPSANQYLRIWYIPRMQQLVADNDILDGISGWTEYVIVDAAIKALQKEESSEAVQILMSQKAALKQRIEESAMNRDAGQPDTISNTRSWGERSGSYGNGGFDGNFGGY